VPATAHFLSECIRDAWQKPFRGEIYEYGAGLDLQASYSVKGCFDIASAPWLVEPFQAIADPRVRIVTIQGAVQTLKSLIADVTVPYWIEHDPGDILWLQDTDDHAKDYANERAMPLIRSIPGIYRMLQDVDRHEKTHTKIRFSHCNLTIAGLNEGNVQRLSYRYIVIDEGWLSRASGLIRQAIYRTTQYPDTCKVIVMGQGGIEDEDFDKLHKESDQRVLHFKCPFCTFAQPFDLARLRGNDHPTLALRGGYSGLSWDTNETTKPGGRWNWEAVGCSAHLRCYQCDARIEDRPTVRRQLADSYSYRASNPGAPKEQVGFQWAAPTSPRILLGKLAVKYLKAKLDAAELGYRLPLHEFYQKDWGLTWSESATTEHRAVIHEPYDIKSAWPDEAHRCLIVDCQRDLEKFFYSVFAIALSGEARELARGKAGSFDELAEIQVKHQIKDQMVFLDCGFSMTAVLRECVKRGHVGTVKSRGGKASIKVWLCWCGLKGSGAHTFLHVHSRTGNKEHRIYSPRKWYDTGAGTDQRSPRAGYVEFSNLHAKDLLRARRDQDPGVPKLRFLPDDLPGSDQWSHFAQMRSERRKEEFKAGKKSAVWELVKQGRPNHEWDKAQMLMIVMALLGVIGNPEAEAESEPETALAE
jgi:hypothetical protein